MHFASAWLLAFVCLVVGGCAVAAMPPPQTLMPLGPAQLQRAPIVNKNGSRLGPPNPGGLGQRRVDCAGDTNAAPARE